MRMGLLFKAEVLLMPKESAWNRKVFGLPSLPSSLFGLFDPIWLVLLTSRTLWSLYSPFCDCGTCRIARWNFEDWVECQMASVSTPDSSAAIVCVFWFSCHEMLHSHSLCKSMSKFVVRSIRMQVTCSVSLKETAVETIVWPPVFAYEAEQHIILVLNILDRVYQSLWELVLCNQMYHWAFLFATIVCPILSLGAGLRLKRISAEAREEGFGWGSGAQKSKQCRATRIDIRQQCGREKWNRLGREWDPTRFCCKN